MSLAEPTPNARAREIPEGVAAAKSEDIEDNGLGVEPTERLARPTYWPAGIAFGITLLAWGTITSFVLIGAGLAVFVVSLIGWIGELRDE